MWGGNNGFLTHGSKTKCCRGDPCYTEVFHFIRNGTHCRVASSQQYGSVFVLQRQVMPMFTYMLCKNTVQPPLCICLGNTCSIYLLYPDNRPTHSISWPITARHYEISHLVENHDTNHNVELDADLREILKTFYLESSWNCSSNDKVQPMSGQLFEFESNPGQLICTFSGIISTTLI